MRKRFAVLPSDIAWSMQTFDDPRAAAAHAEARTEAKGEPYVVIDLHDALDQRMREARANATQETNHVAS